MVRLALLLAGLTAPTALWALTVEVANLRSHRGDVVVMVFAESNESDFPMRYAGAVQTLVRPASEAATFHIKALPNGRYAIRVHHDENGNGALDKRAGLFPAEGLGFSNAARLGMFGPPSFRAAAFELKAAPSILIEVVYP